MIEPILTLLLGILVILAIIAANGYFVAQEFAYMAVDRTRLAARAAEGDEPVESAAVGGQDIATIRQLVEHSAKVGTLKPQMQRQISGLIDLDALPIEALVDKDTVPTHVVQGATVADVHAAAVQSGHLRILLLGPHGATPSVVHVRDTLLEPATRPAHELARRAFVLDAQTPVYEALAHMRKARVQLSVIMSDGRLRGVVTLADILKRVLPGAAAS